MLMLSLIYNPWILRNNPLIIARALAFPSIISRGDEVSLWGLKAAAQMWVGERTLKVVGQGSRDNRRCGFPEDREHIEWNQKNQLL